MPRGPVPAQRDYIIVQVESYSDEAFRDIRKAIHAAAVLTGERDATTTVRDAPLKEDRVPFMVWRDADDLFDRAFKLGTSLGSDDSRRVRVRS